MERTDAADYLNTMALALELLGESPHRIAAFSRAARIVQDTAGEAWIDWLAGRRPAPQGIGAGIRKRLDELARRGVAADLEALLLQIPPSLFDLLKLRGLGPRRVRTLWVDANIITLHQLERACRRGRLAHIRGFGERLQLQMQQEIRRLRRTRGLWLRHGAILLAQEHEERLRHVKGLIEIARAGQLRRALETVSEIVWVIAADEPSVLLGRLARLEGASLPNRGSPDTVLVDAPDAPRERMIVTAESHLAGRLFLETGSRAHTRSVLRSLANAGARLESASASERAADRAESRNRKPAGVQPAARVESVARKNGGAPLSTGGIRSRDQGAHERVWLPRSEEEIYERAGMAYVPPELREGRGEVLAARRGEIPALIRAGDLKGVLHVHTTWSDGKASIRQMAEEARALGWSYLGIADHSQAAFYARGLSAERLRRQAEEIRSLQTTLADMRIFRGIECDILPDGSLDLDSRTLEALDYVIVSIHSVMKMDRDAMTERIIRAMRHPAATILAHPSGRLLLERESYGVHWDRILDAAAETRVALEFNSVPERLDLDWRLIRSATDRGIPICINPDAHHPQAMRNVLEGIETARKGWLTPQQVLNTRSAGELEAYLSEVRHRD